MGVYLPNVDMPKNCFDCKLCYDAFYCKVLEIGFYDDRDKEYRQEGFDPETARLQGCPLVSVPAHGDLVDRAEMRGIAISLLDKAVTDQEANAIREMWSRLGQMPVYIPEEEEP